MSRESRVPLDSGLVLPGWNCASCLVFNSEEKNPRHECRSCGAERKTFGLPLENVLSYMRHLEENIAAVQTRCGELLEENRQLRHERGLLKLEENRQLRHERGLLKLEEWLQKKNE